ncbi:MAG: vitamin B12-dependent ribonucleotide reductase [Candidatus Schekmanbacteria bacterium]|nr:vitamin B12-dependent ribonucleotide reductase [Candidatus Schekmanbacteria bacterium]
MSRLSTEPHTDRSIPKPPRPLQNGQWTEAAIRVLKERYLLRDHEEIVETPEDMCWRVAWAMIPAERRYCASEEDAARAVNEYYEMMVNGWFLPNSPTLMNAGRTGGLQYSACFVLPVEDSLPGIFDAVKNAAIIHQSGGGTGFAFSRLRAKNSLVRRSGGRASGPVSFLRVFDAATESVKQGGRRRGANMGVLRIDHPDVLEFIDCKLSGGITNFNISLGVTEEFMRALREDRNYALIAPESGKTVSELSACMVFDQAVQAAWATGDPGMIFIDRVNKSSANPTPALGEIEATNPCGEQPLLPNEACNLGSINLGAFVSAAASGAEAIDWESLRAVVHRAVRFLDDVIEVNPYPLPAIDQAVKANRRIGLGVMGWADALFKLGVPYDSEEAIDIAGRMMAFVQQEGHRASEELAVLRGPFPNWPHSIYAQGKPLRNSTVTTIAPTGTISIIAGCSSGIEPIFALAFRHVVGERELTFVNPVFAAQLERLPEREAARLREAAAAHGSLGGMAQAPERLRHVFVTAHDIPYPWHIRMQAAFQRHTDNGVSKTVNLPNEATVEDVANAYRLAYDLGCLGITVFRDACKGTQVLHVGTAGASEDKPAPQALPVPPPVRRRERSHEEIRPRPQALAGTTYKIDTPLGTAYITINNNGGGAPFEVFCNVGKAGSDIAAVSEGLGRLVSLLLRMPSPYAGEERLEEIINQLSGIGGGRHVGFGPERVRSLPDAMAHVLATHLETLVTSEPAMPPHGKVTVNGGGRPESGAPEAPHRNGKKSPAAVPLGDLCPDCGNATLVREEGCMKCHCCGFSEC